MGDIEYTWEELREREWKTGSERERMYFLINIANNYGLTPAEKIF